MHLPASIQGRLIAQNGTTIFTLIYAEQGTTLADYDLTLNQTFADKLFGITGPLDLKFTDAVPPGTFDDVELYQLSWNPLFFNTVFGVNAEDIYNFVLTLSPKAGGAPLKAHIQVVVTDPVP